jgi:hypothetical protein
VREEDCLGHAGRDFCQPRQDGQLRHFETVGGWMTGADTDLTFV